MITNFEKIGFWKPLTAFDTVLHPRRWRHVFHYPVSIRFEDSEWAQHPSVIRWTYSQRSHEKRLLLTFTSENTYKNLSYRWRNIANALGRLIRHSPKIEFSDIPVDVSDCTDSSVPENTFRFAKLFSDPHDLIPNPFLLKRTRRTLRSIKWERKLDSLYFRGALTGTLQSFDNSRVAACLAAKKILNSDCGLTDFPQTPPNFLTTLRSQGFCTEKDPTKTLDKHRYLLDIDGNTSSWHRFWLIGTFGCVPIRFETKWVEYWHKNIEEGKHFLYANRETLSEIVDFLRKHPEKAISVANNASKFIRNELSPVCAQKSFEEAWLGRIHSGY